MKSEDLKLNKILRGPLFPEPVRVVIATPVSPRVKLVGKGLNTSKAFEVVRPGAGRVFGKLQA